MYAYRGRSGPSRSTPANVQCQKCLKRGHYSYECKASTQERPYVPRPSRSQQLRNPKLVPKLTNDTLNPLEKKEGIADSILAKKEAERTRQREREEREEQDLVPSPKRRRSVSPDSVSTISTAASRRSRSPARSLSPPPQTRSRRSPSYDDARRTASPERSLSRSPLHMRHSRRSLSRDSLSPREDSRDRRYRDRDEPDYGNRSQRSRRNSFPRREAPEARQHIAYDSRSSEARRRGSNRGGRGGRSRDHIENRGNSDSGGPRQRSLSPFSRRLAMTQSMNRGGR